MKIRDRWVLVSLICIGECICLVAAVGWLSNNLASALSRGATGVDLGLVATMRQLSMLAAVLLVGVTGALTYAAVRRYETRLARVNGELEVLVAQRGKALMRTRDAVIFGLAKLAESRDHETGEHLYRIHHYTKILADELVAEGKLDAQHAGVIAHASSLHDIGKVGITDAVLLKPGPLDPQERREMQKHTLIGGRCLEAIRQHLGADDFLSTACEIAYCHHERWDGRGYPHQLAGEDIPVSGRIVALADVYDALTSARVYKRAIGHALARKIIVEESGTQFDPQIVAAFLKWEDKFAHIAQQSAEQHQASVETTGVGEPQTAA